MTASRRWRLPLPQPYDVRWMEWFLAAHAVPGVERFQAGVYARTVRLPQGDAALTLRFGKTVVEAAVVGDGLSSVALQGVTRRLLDTDVDISAVEERLQGDPMLAAAAARAPGVRVPGVVDGSRRCRESGAVSHRLRLWQNELRVC